ncbi:MAG: sigma-70 family RNA polymerase sigma factor [Chloroflexi bacterium]|nr:sigma-70 family RNA polymerase sigma factor [Chloroflexota bacterium]
MNEEELIAQAISGSVDAFNQLVELHQQTAYNLAYRILGDQEYATDATQEAFIRCYRSLEQFRGGAFRAWLLRIVTNCCYDQLRARRRRPNTPIDDMVEDEEHSDILRDDAETPEEHLEHRELYDALQLSLEVLPPEQRTIVVLSDIEGLSYEEIAVVTSLALGTVKSRLNRARGKLRDYLLAHKELLPEHLRH